MKNIISRLYYATLFFVLVFLTISIYCDSTNPNEYWIGHIPTAIILGFIMLFFDAIKKSLFEHENGLFMVVFLMICYLIKIGFVLVYSISILDSCDSSLFDFSMNFKKNSRNNVKMFCC